MWFWWRDKATDLVVQVLCSKCHIHLNSTFGFPGTLNQPHTPVSTHPEHCCPLRGSNPAWSRCKDPSLQSTNGQHSYSSLQKFSSQWKHNTETDAGCLLSLQVGTGKQGSVTHCTSSKMHSSFSLHWYVWNNRTLAFTHISQWMHFLNDDQVTLIHTAAKVPQVRRVTWTYLTRIFTFARWAPVHSLFVSKLAFQVAGQCATGNRGWKNWEKGFKTLKPYSWQLHKTPHCLQQLFGNEHSPSKKHSLKWVI